MKPCRHCKAASFGGCCDACRTATRNDRQDDQPRPVRAVGASDLEAAEDRQASRLRALDLTRQALQLLQQAAAITDAATLEECVYAAGQATERAALDLAWYSERAAEGIEILRRRTAA
jgi:hypothetical protein